MGQHLHCTVSFQSYILALINCSNKLLELHTLQAFAIQYHLSKRITLQSCQACPTLPSPKQEVEPLSDCQVALSKF